MHRIGAIILAAGNSSRLGQPKQFLLFEGETLLARAVRAAREAPCIPIVLVTGDNSAPGKDPGIITVPNEKWADGLGTSIRCGLQKLLAQAPESEGVILLVCDQPHLDADVLRRLIERQHESNHPIVASQYAKTLGVPALFLRECFSELQDLPAAAGAKRVIQSDPTRVAAVDFPLGAVDIDTAADLGALD